MLQNQKNTKSAYAMLTASMLIVGTVGIFRRFIPLSSALLAFSRGFIGAIVLALFLLVRKGGAREGIPRKKWLLLLVNGAALGINWLLLFEAYNYTTVATATLCYYLQPTIVILLSPLVFKERITGKKLLCACMALCGMVFISGVLNAEGLRGTNGKGILFAVGAACFYATVVMLGKKLGDVDVYVKTMVQLFLAAVIMLPYLLVTENIHALSLDAQSVLLVLLLGIVHTGIAYMLYFGSMTALSAQTISILSYIDPVTALLLSALVLHEGITVQGLIGAVLIIGSALVSEIKFSNCSSIRFAAQKNRKQK